MLAMNTHEAHLGLISPSQTTLDLDLAVMLDFALYDLRQPLAAAQILLEYLRAELDLSPEAADIVESLEEAIGGIGQRLQVLESFRGGEPPKEVVDLADVVRAVRVQHWHALQERSIQLHGLDLPLRVWANRGIMQRALARLVENALQHATGARNIWIRAYLSKTEAHLVVRDDGPGWPGSRPTVPRGRGLRFCAWAVEQFGGRLEIGDGSEGGEFILILSAVEHLSDEPVDRSRTS